ncbi:imidazolonepropionase [Ameyamaea chiangmaiensis NBRC 103196]|uniref:Imidazolonepropionase n=1 Tax=Ameyamaea chiangmaiensis TaxID=442969 RepID=A0A850P8E8_9PROT|nr:imidazolonepropionase [Ameyamaea chiangmaiensis]MBS4075509.1 imidazolonepropionase [Ameyamaea chiangmaiensis]NVN38959.1 imidazolonepropionase [Ameyamaea chiangmaiensis]GBQ69488.1 imidazolonepropionase [Ameyamaea chiangmaiensis NBRC 103196]
MWDRLWIGINAATMDIDRDAGPYGLIDDAAIGVRDGRIVWVGARADLSGRPGALARQVIDGDGALVTPGLIDAHTHIVFAGDRSGEFERRLNGERYADIAREGGGILATVRATRAADEAALLASALGRARRMIAAGTTTIEIKSGYGLTEAGEIKMLRVARAIETALPVRVRTSFLAAHALPPEYAGRPDAYVDHICEDMLPAVVAEGLVDAVDAFCEGIAFSPDQVSRVFEAARSAGRPVRLHADQMSDRNGGALAAAFGALSADHIEYLNEGGVAAMAAAGTVAMLLPGAFYFIGETMQPPVAQLRAAGVPIGLATDCNPGTSPMTSLTAVMNMGCTLFRLTPAEALSATTRVAAKALGMVGEVGCLRAGLHADLAFWAVSGPQELSYWIGGVMPSGRVFAGVPDDAV